MVPLLSDGEGQFGWNIVTIGAAISLYYLVGSLTSPIAGMLGDRFGARPIMFGCGALYLASMFLVGIVSAAWHFFIAFGVLLAITQAFTFVPLQASVGGWFRRRLGLATGLLQAAGGIGAALTGPGGGRAAGIRGLARNLSGASPLSAADSSSSSSLFFRSKPADAGVRPYGARGDEPPEISPPAEILKLRLKVFGQHMRRTRAFWNLPTIHGLGCAGHGIVLIYVIEYAKEMGIGVTQGAFILTCISICSIAGRFIVPILAEKMGGKPVMIVALFLQGVTVAVLFFADSPWTFYLFGTLFGLGFGGEMSAYLVVNRQYFGAGPMATLYGFEIMGAMMGHAIATLTGGLLREITGSYLPVFGLSMGFSIVGVLVILTLESTKRVLIPNWENSLPPEARTESLFRRRPPDPRPAAPSTGGALCPMRLPLPATSGRTKAGTTQPGN